MNRLPLEYSVSPNRKAPYTSYSLKTEYQQQQPAYDNTYKKRHYYEAQKDQELFQSEVTRDLQKQNTNLFKTQAETEFYKQEEQIKELVKTLQDQDRELNMLRQMKDQYTMTQSTMQNQTYKIKDIEEQCFNLMNELNQKTNEIDHLKNKIFSQSSLLKEAMVRVKELEQIKLKVNEQDEQREAQERREESQAYQFKKAEEAYRLQQEKFEEEIRHLKTMLHKEENQRGQIIQSRENDMQIKVTQLQGSLNQQSERNKLLSKQNEDLQKGLDRSNQLVDSLEGCLKELQKQYETNKLAVEHLTRKNRQTESSLIKENEGLNSQVSGQQKDNMILQGELQEKEDYIKQIIADMNNKLQEAQEAYDDLMHQNKECSKYNEELKSSIVSYKAIIDEMKKIQGEQFQKEQEYQKMEVKDIANKYTAKIDMITQDNYQLRMFSHQCEEENETIRVQLKQLSIQNKQLHENQQNLEKEIYVGREKYKDMQQCLESELKNQEEKNLHEFQIMEERAMQMSEKLSRKIQGLQALVKDRNQEIEVLQSQKNELLLKLCEGDSTYNNARTSRSQKKGATDHDNWR